MPSRQRDENRVPAIRTERDNDGTDEDRQDCEHPPQGSRRVVDARLIRRIPMDGGVGRAGQRAGAPVACSPQLAASEDDPAVDLLLGDVVASVVSSAQRLSLLSVQGSRRAAIHRGRRARPAGGPRPSTPPWPGPSGAPVWSESNLISYARVDPGFVRPAQLSVLRHALEGAPSLTTACRRVGACEPFAPARDGCVTGHKLSRWSY